MAKNVVGLFDTMQDAEAVVRDLRDAGVGDADISFAGRNSDAATMESNQYVGEGHSEAAEGAGFGATGGTVVGGLTGLLVGLGALAIPGIGPVVAAGSLATALGSAALGAGIGAATGGLLGALVGAGIPEEDANFYAEGIRRGGALVMARVDDNNVDTALDIMERHNVVDIDERGSQYRESGWTRFDENATPYNATGDADRVPGESDYDRSSKVGTAGGAVAGAATGAAIGSVGGPVGTVVGGAAGALTGAGVGAAGDAAGVEATDDDRGRATYDTAGTSYADTTDTTTGTTANTTYGSTTDTSYSSTGDADRVPDESDYDRSSKVGTAGGALAGAATGAAIGSVGGPVGTVVGGVAGAVTGGGVGAAGDAAGAELTDDDRSRASYDNTYSTRDLSDTTAAGGTAYGSATDISGSSTANTDYATTGNMGTNPVGTGYSSTDTGYRGTGDADRVPDGDDYDRSSKVGTAGGAVAGAATGAAIGSVGGPVGTVIGGVAGAVTGGGVGAAGDAAGAELTDDDRSRASYDNTTTGGTAYGSATDYSDTTDARNRPTGSFDTGMSNERGGGEGIVENTASRIENATERGLDADLDRDGDVGRRDPSNNV